MVVESAARYSMSQPCKDELSQSLALAMPEQFRKMLHQTSVVVKGPIAEQLATIDFLTANRYQKLIMLIHLINHHFAKVQRAAQLYQQWNLVQAARNCRITEGRFDFDDEALEARGALQATVLLVRSCLFLFISFKGVDLNEAYKTTDARDKAKYC
ncbi:hypothetical protein BCR37DRAFT_95294 [Protomyces lactucae-debilis]|uniref:Uncharacterized protein n=1 Tax=Protomyces lactucae-debilis TaxID=2754530 RepID=A0A1Y2F6E0_PROLT|nr:uncharacterized protein BCR37DRAFT_95294 [Protomyces lactucae-debilis]ORY79468.1 hypothetical protein BCR37DRAFT_95294 [Protomyces lactucae-debilis]